MRVRIIGAGAVGAVVGWKLYKVCDLAFVADKERKARLEKEGKGGDFKPEYEERDVEPAEIIVAKNRNGETKTIRIQFRKRFTRFENPETNETPHPETKLNVDEIRSIVGSF